MKNFDVKPKWGYGTQKQSILRIWDVLCVHLPNSILKTEVYNCRKFEADAIYSRSYCLRAISICGKPPLDTSTLKYKANWQSSRQTKQSGFKNYNFEVSILLLLKLTDVNQLFYCFDNVWFKQMRMWSAKRKFCKSQNCVRRKSLNCMFNNAKN